MQLLSVFLLLSLRAVMVIGQATLEVEDVIDARLKWEALQESLGPLDYKYLVTDITKSDAMNVPTMVLVEADNVTEVEDVFFIGDEDPVPSDFLTVNAMLDLMEEQIEDGSTVTSVFDRTYGFPLEYTITNDDEEVVSHVIIDPMTIYSVAQQELDIHVALWTNTSTFDYDYTTRVSCFCIPSATTPKRINVRDGEIENATDIETGLEEENIIFSTIDDLFEEIQGGIDGRWIIVDAQYNDTMGYPTRFFFDVHPGLADEERATEVYDVVVFADSLPDIDAEISFTDSDAGVVSTPRPTLVPTGGSTASGIDAESTPTAPPTSNARGTATAGAALVISIASVAFLGCM